MKNTTPGPWEYRVEPRIQYKYATGEKFENAIHSVYSGNILVAMIGYELHSDSITKRADGLLIAAAPDMLAALEMILSGVLAKDAVSAVRAAIAKAKGTT